MTPDKKTYGRLNLCAEMVRRGSRLADIGTDHGYLPISLCREEKIPSALACDINPLPLRSAQHNILKYNLSDRIRTRLSDGLLQVRPDEADDIVIAGMGGELIRDILTAAPWVRDRDKHLVLQPMTHHEDLIRWLYENGFVIDRQEAVKDADKYYTVLSAHYTGETRACDLYTAIVGKLALNQAESRAFLSRSLQNLRNKCKGDPSLLPTVQQLEEAIRETE